MYTKPSTRLALASLCFFVLQSLMLQIAANMIETEKKEAKQEKDNFMAAIPALDLSGDQAALVEMLKKLAQTVDKVDEERYDAEAKVKKSEKEIEDLKMKVVEVQGIKKPALKKVRLSADAMLAALLGTKHKASMDFRSNLKEVKKEVKEESLVLQIAFELIEAEKKEAKQEKDNFMAEIPALDLSGDQAALVEMLKKLAQTIDKVDEDRYDAEAKVKKADKEIEDLKMKVVEIQGMKKPALKKVRMSADAMLQALLGTKHKASMDFRANLKEVKKEVKEEAADAVGDWRKNVDEQAGMDGRKKKFPGLNTAVFCRIVV
ncbi:unnamed protein product [Coregonus sp. 'balchen']|nr:unnamed protein product [Coregonus sp. 'balchen']